MATIESSTKYLIELGLPPRALNPNAKPHWRTLTGARKKYREHSGLCTLAALNTEKPRWQKATARVTFSFPQHRNHDEDNLLASLKSAWDGMVDAGLLEDDHGLTVQTPPTIVKGRPGVRIEVWKT